MSAHKCFVVRSDVGNKPCWLEHASGKARYNVIRPFEMTEDPRRACRFASMSHAQEVADAWSDVPGVWRVLVRPPRIAVLSKSVDANQPVG